MLWFLIIGLSQLECAAKATDFDLLISVPKEPKESKLSGKRHSELIRVKKLERESVCGVVGATSTPSTVGLFSFLTMLFLPTFSQN